MAGGEAPKKLCHAQRQQFVDCMFVLSPCVQAGARPFKDCLQQELDDRSMHPDCVQLFREFQRCRAQMVRPAPARLLTPLVDGHPDTAQGIPPLRHTVYLQTVLELPGNPAIKGVPDEGVGRVGSHLPCAVHRLPVGPALVKGLHTHTPRHT